MRLRFWQRRPRDAELDEEIRGHLEMAARDRVASGESAEAAAYAARREFGNVGQVKELTRQMWVGASLERLLDELRQVLRRLVRSPGFALAVIVSLALGIGADVTALGLADSLLFRSPAHVGGVDRVVDVRIRTYPDFVDLRDQARSFSGIAAWYAPPLPYGISVGDRVVAVQQMLGSASLFPVLGVEPVLGRFYTRAEDQPGGPHLAVLGYGLWQRLFGGAHDVLGRTLRVAGDVYTIIGVAPQGFTGVALNNIDLFLPITTTKFDAGPQALTSRNYSWIRVVARLAPGVTAAKAQAEAKAIYRQGNPDTTTSPWLIRFLGGQPADVHSVIGLRRELAAASMPVTPWLAGLATAVLLIACANVGGLMLARAARARHEIAMRAALGASRARLVIGLLLESGTLALAGGVLGLLASRRADVLIGHLILTDLAPVRSPLDGRRIAIALGVTLVTVLLCGVGPALATVRGNLSLELASAGRSVAGAHTRARRMLLVVQLALAMVLVVGAALFVTSLRNAEAQNIGMSLGPVVVSDLNLQGAGYTPERAHALIDPIVQRLAGIPGVRSVALSDTDMRPGWITYWYSVPGRDSLPRVRALRDREHFSAVTPGFFATVGIPVLSGRPFTDGDRMSRVIIVSQEFARRYWPGEDPIGQCAKVGDAKAPCLEVIGVSHDRRIGPGDTTAFMEAFVPLGSPGEPAGLAKLYPLGSVALRVLGNPQRVAVEAQRVLQGLMPDAPSIRVHPAQELFDRGLRPRRLGASLFTAFGLIALALGMLGVYSLMAYLVAQRARELAIRSALGATAGDLSRLVIGETARITIVGVVLGLVAAGLVARGLKTQLFGISALNPIVYAGAALALGAAALAATAVPVRRAVAADPSAALREE